MTSAERRLLRLYRALPESRRAGLIDYAEYLLARTAGEAEAATPLAPHPIPRPESESVVQAIKRLSATYPMLKRDALLHETSRCMTDHILHKRPAAVIIDELEALFQRQYEAYCQTLAATTPPAHRLPPQEDSTSDEGAGWAA